MSNSINRRLLKARNERKAPSHYGDVNDNVECAEEFSRHKHKFETKITPATEMPIKDDLNTPPNKFSANNRLKTYRAVLSATKNKVKVHQALISPKSPDGSGSSISLNKSADANLLGLLGKRSLTIDKESENCQDSRSSASLNKSLDASLESRGLLGKRSLTIDKESEQFNNSEVPIKKSKSNEKTEIVSSWFQRGTYNETEESNDMVWSPVDQEEVISNIQRLRGCKEDCSLKLDPIPYASEKNITKERNENVKERVKYIVADTNIFISHLSLVRTILLQNDDDCQYIVYIPWMVLQELDYFKDGQKEGKAVISAARKAVKFINENLSNNQSRLKGQTVHEAFLQQGTSSNPDDQIVFCCMHLAQNNKSVILLSNDVNLRNKALINAIPSYSSIDILQKIKETSNNEIKEQFQKVSSIFAEMCTHIIVAEMTSAYGSVLYNLITKPPWDLKQCLLYIKRFWNPVFSLSISQKQCLKAIEDLLKIVQNSKDITDQKDMNEFLKQCFNICVYFKNCLIKYKKVVIDCIKHMQEVLS